MTFLWLLFAHHLADVAFQPTWLIATKKRHLWAIYEHAMVWGGVVSLALVLLGLFAPWKAAFLVIGHFVIDAAKYRSKHYWATYPDQAAHYVQLAVVCWA